TGSANISTRPLVSTKSLSADAGVATHSAVAASTRALPRLLNTKRIRSLRDLQQVDQVAADDRFFLRIGQEGRVDDEIERIGPVERDVCAVNDLAHAHLGHEMTQTLVR